MPRLNKFAFNGGELSDWLSPRVDLARYHNGCERLRNMQVIRYGGARRRSGTLYMATTKTSGKTVRLQGFDFSRTDGVIVEFGEYYMRFYRSGASAAAILVSSPPAWALATYYEGGLTVAHGGTTYVALSSHTSAAGTEPGVGASWATVWSAITGSIYELPTPWLEADLQELQFAQRNDVIVVTHRDHEARLLSRYADTQWTIATLPWKWRPWRELNGSDTTMTPSATTGSITVTASAPTFAASWVGSRMRLVHFDEEQVFNRNLDWAWNPATYDADYAAGDAMVAFNPLNTYDTAEPGATNPSRVNTNAGGTTLDPSYRCILNYTPAAWAAGGATYAADDIHTLGGVAYRCILGHTSTGTGATDEPGVGATWATFWVAVTNPTDAPNHFALGVVLAGPVTVAGGWEFETTGVWDGGWRIERSYDGGTNYQTVKTMETEGTANFTTDGEEDPDTPALYRLLSVSGPNSGYTSPVFFRVLSREVTGKVLISGYTSTTQVSATVETELAAISATKDWSEDAYNARNGHASACTFHESRLFLGGSTRDPEVLYGSQTEDYFNFREGTNDDEGLKFQLNSNQYNEISWLVSQRSLLVGTTGAEWVIRTAEEAPLTPSNAQAFLHTSNGSFDRQAFVMQDAAIYVQRGARKIIEMAGNQFDGYKGRDLTVLSEHVTNGQVSQIALQRNLDTTLHVVTGDGELAGMVYERAEEIAGWHRWDSPAATGTIESVATCYGHGEEDEVWWVAKRTINGATVRCIERMVPDQVRAEEDADQDSLVYVDCGVRYAGGAATVITGLTHLEGETVQVLADGYDAGDYTVASGQITLAAAAEEVSVGLGFTSELRPMPFDEVGSLGLKKAVNHLMISFRNSLSCEAGDHVADKWATVPFRTPEENPNAAPALKTETASVTVPNLHARAKSVTLRQTRPVPLTITAIMPEVSTGRE